MTSRYSNETPRRPRRLSLALGLSILIHGFIVAPVFFLEDTRATKVWSVGIPVSLELESPVANTAKPAEVTSRQVATAKTLKASTPRAPAKTNTKLTPQVHSYEKISSKRKPARAKLKSTPRAVDSESKKPDTNEVTKGEDQDYQAPRYREGSAQNPKPDYPYVALLEGWKGRVVLKVKVDTGGQVLEVHVRQSSGYDLLDQAARETITRWVFAPAQRQGRAVVAQVDVPIRFELD